MRNLKIAVVDDEERQREILGDILRDEGHAVEIFATAPRVLDRLSAETFDLLLTDLRMPQMDGHELLRAARQERPELLVILMTAYATVDSAVEAMKDGAFDYIQKPFGKSELIQRVRRAAERVALQRENAELRRALSERSRILGESAATKRLLSQLQKVAAGVADVLVTGESGTGKELAARRIHELSSRVTGAFVPVNCAAIPDGLAESEIFGHEKGAFTNATAVRHGKFEQADGGTLFLDEIGSMPLALQPKLLRVIQDRIVERVGGSRPKKVDVRVIAATNCDLSAMVAEGRFREDLYHRLNVLEVHLPPLRGRAEDIALLARVFRDESATRTGVPPPEIDGALMSFLEEYAFPGNVRELEHLMEKMVVLSDGEALTLADLPPSITARRPPERADIGRAAPWDGETSPESLLGESSISLPEVEERLLREAIRKSRGNLSEAARRLGISYKTMQYRARKFGLG